MRSLYYILTKKPLNLDDCIDLSEKRNVKRISLDLVSREEFTETHVIKYLLGKYTLKFDDEKIFIEKVYGGCLFNESDERQIKSVDNANRRLEKDIELLNDLNFKLKNQTQRFDYPKTLVW